MLLMKCTIILCSVKFSGSKLASSHTDQHLDWIVVKIIIIKIIGMMQHYVA